MRPMGDIMLDMEQLIFEMVDDHDLQHGDILGMIHTYLLVHCPGAREEYEEDGSNPVFYYGAERRERFKK